MSFDELNENVVNALIRGAEAHGVSHLLFDMGAALEAQEYLTASTIGMTLFEVLDVGRWLTRFPHMTERQIVVLKTEPQLAKFFEESALPVFERDYYYICVSDMAARKYYNAVTGGES